MTIGLLDYKHTRLRNMCVPRGYIEPKLQEVVHKISHSQLPHRLRMSIWVHCFLYLYNHLQVGTVDYFRPSYLMMQT